MTTIEKSIRDNVREKVYLKYYFTDDTYEEIAHNLPNDLLFNIDGVPSSGELLDLTRYVYDAWRKKGINLHNIEFPFEFNFSVINRWVLEKDQIFRQEYDRENKSHIEYRPFFLEFSGYCSRQELPSLLEMIVESERMYLTGYFLPEEDSNFLNELRENNENRIIAIMEGNLLVSASPIACIGGKLVIVEDKTEVDPLFADILNDDIYRCKQNAYTSIDAGKINKRLIKSFPICRTIEFHGYASESITFIRNNTLIL